MNVMILIFTKTFALGAAKEARFTVTTYVLVVVVSCAMLTMLIVLFPTESETVVEREVTPLIVTVAVASVLVTETITHENPPSRDT